MSGFNFSISLSAVQSAITRQDVTANNLANINTLGYKSAQTHQSENAGGGTHIDATPHDTSQGPVAPTGAPLDLAINGEGYFRIRRGDGSLAFTRDGSFHLDGDGNVVNVHGEAIDPPIQLPPNAVSVTIGESGSVTANLADGTSVEAGQIEIATFPNPDGLQSVGGNLLRPTPNSGTGVSQAPGLGSAGVVVPGAVEGSNVDLAAEMVNSIVNQRDVEANTAAIRTKDEMLGTILDIKK